MCGCCRSSVHQSVEENFYNLTIEGADSSLQDASACVWIIVSNYVEVKKSRKPKESHVDKYDLLQLLDTPVTIWNIYAIKSNATVHYCW